MRIPMQIDFMNAHVTAQCVLDIPVSIKKNAILQFHCDYVGLNDKIRQIVTDQRMTIIRVLKKTLYQFSFKS